MLAKHNNIFTNKFIIVFIILNFKKIPNTIYIKPKNTIGPAIIPTNKLMIKLEIEILLKQIAIIGDINIIAEIVIPIELYILFLNLIFLE